MAALSSDGGRTFGEPIAIETHLHLTSDHVQAATPLGWVLEDMRERVVDEAFTSHKPSWERHLGWPISFALAWRSR